MKPIDANRAGRWPAFVFFALLILGCASSFAQSVSKEQAPDADEEESGESILARDRYFHLRRAGGPGKEIPDDAYAKAVEQHRALVRKEKAFRTDASLPSWSSVNPTGMFYNRTGSNYISGRTNSIAFDPADPTIIYIAAAGGGVWRSTDDGVNWTVLTDSLPSLACGAIATDPLTSDVIYLGTGELNYSGDSYYGAGLFKSTDAGATWTQLFNTTLGKYYSAIVIDPITPANVFVASDKAVSRSTNGGANWTSTTSGSYVNSLVMDPSNPATLYAATGATGANSIRKTTNSGSTWTTLTTGLPTTTMGRTTLAIAPTNGNIIYASIANKSNSQLVGIYRTTDGGATWSLRASAPNYLGGQGWYANSITVSPLNSDQIAVGGLDVYASSDGGATLTQVSVWFTSSHNSFSHADIHFLGYNANSGYLYCGSDGGVYRSSNNGTTWNDLNQNLSTLQYQSADYNPFSDQKYAGGTQDNNMERTADGGATWIQYTTGDGGYTVIDPVTPNVVYGQYVQGSVERSEDEGIGYVEFSPNGGTGGLFYNPYELAPGDPNTMVFAQSNIFKTTSAQTATSSTGWTQISGSLGTSVSAIAISPTSTDKIFVGTANGQILTTTNNGTSWSTPITGLPFVSDLIFDGSNDAICYASCSGFSPTTHVLKTTNSGATWTNITSNLPNIPVNTIILRNTLPRMIFLGTDLGVYRSTDEGATWTSFNSGLPTLSVFDLKYKEGPKKLLAATHGRGVWKYDLSAFSFGASPIALAFGNVPSNGSKLDSIVVTNTGTTTITVSNVSSDNAKFVVTPLAGSIPASTTMTFHVTYTPLVNGSDAGHITFTHSGITSPDIITVSGTGALPMFSVSPSSLALGTTLPGMTLTDSVTVSNPGTAMLMISSVTSTNGEFSVSPTSANIAGGGAQKFGIQFNPSSTGPKSSSIIFAHNAISTPDTVLATGNGGSAYIQTLKLDDVDGNLSTTGDQSPKAWHFDFYKDSVSAGTKIASKDSESATVVVPSAGTYIVAEADSGYSWARINGNMSKFDTLAVPGAGAVVDTFVNRRFVLAETVQDKWNMLSLPLVVADSSVLTLFPEAATQAYRYLSAYQTSANMSPGVGYWLKFNGIHGYLFPGAPLSSIVVDVHTGWNLIGGPYGQVVTSTIGQSPSGIVASKYFQYGTGYTITDTLYPGSGYWVKTNQAGQLTLTTPPPSAPKTDQAQPATLRSSFAELSMSDASGGHQSVYVGPISGLKSPIGEYELPPASPVPVADIRFAGGLMVAPWESQIDRQYPLTVSAGAFPLTFVWTNEGKLTGSFALAWDGVSGHGSAQLRSGESVIVRDSTATGFVLSHESVVPLPRRYELGQNYPNPFNPSTEIRYQLPSPATVKLQVFNLLGEEVRTLVDRLEGAGYKSVTFNANELPTGVYIYRLQAIPSVPGQTGFADVKKMVLIK